METEIDDIKERKNKIIELIGKYAPLYELILIILLIIAIYYYMQLPKEPCELCMKAGYTCLRVGLNG